MTRILFGKDGLQRERLKNVTKEKLPSAKTCASDLKKNLIKR